jgi:polyadenylate-binding protein
MRLPYGYERYDVMGVNERNNLVGTYLYYKLCRQHGEENAGKLTGMLLELDPEELLGLVKDNTLLSAKADKAMDVWNSHISQN